MNTAQLPTHTHRQSERQTRSNDQTVFLQFFVTAFLYWLCTMYLYADDIPAILHIFYCDVSGLCALLLLL